MDGGKMMRLPINLAAFARVRNMFLFGRCKRERWVQGPRRPRDTSGNFDFRAIQRER